MFKLEREMIPVLRKGLSELYNTNYFIEEFFSGNGKADLVFSSEIFFDELIALDFEQTYYLTNFLNKNKFRFTLDSLTSKHNLNKTKIKSFLEYLVYHDYLKEANGYFQMKRRFTPPVKNLISIEAKLKNWKEGFYQALRYKNFSHKSFLAISEKYINNIDLKLFKSYRVGIISVSLYGIDIVYNPPKEEPLDTTAYYFLATEFATTLSA